MSGTFCLVDCNNFYVSCERAFNPKLEGKPVVILSNNDGCVISRSNEAKKLGVGMGVPIYKIEQMIKKYDIQVYSSNYVLYGDMSERVMSTLEKFVPEIELYSIDEAFLFLNENINDRSSFVRNIRNIVRQHTGIPVSIGVGETKTLAKVANRHAKYYKQFDGVLDITAHPRQDKILDLTKVNDVWGIGHNFGKLLNNNGIFNALQLKNADEIWVKKAMTIIGLKTVYELRGISCINLEQGSSSAKSIIHSRSFIKNTSSLQDLKEAVSFYISRAAERLREQHLLATYLKVFFSTNYFKPTEPQYYNSINLQLPVATSFTRELIHYAFAGLEKIYKPEYLYKKAGVMLTGLISENEAQLNLFSARNNFRENALMEVVDEINQKFGKGKIQFGATGIEKAWKSKPAKSSPFYTTKWDDIPVVINGIV